jgi:CoA:oxalate CoA-transferase
MPRTPSTARPRPLEGLVVVDLSRYIAGPYCTMLLADAGATVIKVEPPHGDDTRRLEPFVESESGDVVSAYFIRMNRGKRSITLDLKSEAGRQTLERLIGKADASVEN